ncbi:unnamed protein product [Moneuplotes crassus]|uniref:C2H2-type domain-containing protein n=1 Tax=Euplotes crassus TaxID=5936 RepID=A0AAD1UD13_EUPCR|nr:unnamed protein product [Moneuplotes crassus]
MEAPNYMNSLYPYYFQTTTSSKVGYSDRKTGIETRNCSHKGLSLNQISMAAKKDQLQEKLSICLMHIEFDLQRKMLNIPDSHCQEVSVQKVQHSICMSISSNYEEEKYLTRDASVLNDSWKTRNIIQNQTSQTNVDNLNALKGYPYSSTMQSNSKNGKLIMVYKCEFNGCHKTFMRTWNLLDHIRMHYGIKPYMCKFCGKGFTQKGNMRKHLIQHEKPHLSNRKKFKCEFCSSSFTERYNYRTHVENKHGISSAVPNFNESFQNSMHYSS